MAGQNLYADYLDPLKKRFPVFGNHVFETLLDFNSGAPTKLGYTAEEVDSMGERLARVISDNVYVYRSDTEFDEAGETKRYSNDNSSASKTQYFYQDGKVLTVSSKSTGSGETEYEKSEVQAVEHNSEVDAVAALFESQHTGDMIKAMRTRKKMSRADMASDMKMTKSRLAEIEDGDTPDDDEMIDIATALGVTPKRFQRMVSLLQQVDSDATSDVGAGVEESSEVYEVVSEVYDIVDVAAQVVESAKNLFTREIYEERRVGMEMKKTHKLVGNFISESLMKNEDGTIRFEVPLFKIDELTSNGNRYTKKCAENLVKDLNNLRRKTSQKDIGGGNGKRRLLDIEIAEYMDGRVPDMMATHRARLGEGNAILEKAGRIIGGRIGEVEGDAAFILIGETLREGAGKAVSEQIEKKMLRGVSLFGLPIEFEENSEGGANTDLLALVGSDFTDDGGNLIQFKDKANAGFTVMN